MTVEQKQREGRKRGGGTKKEKQTRSPGSGEENQGKINPNEKCKETGGESHEEGEKRKVHKKKRERKTVTQKKSSTTGGRTFRLIFSKKVKQSGGEGFLEEGKGEPT